MSKMMRTVGAIILAFFVSGCSSMSVVYGPGKDEIPDPMKWPDVVEFEEKVRITLDDDRVIEGKVVGLSSDSVSVETRIPQEESWGDDDLVDGDDWTSFPTMEIVTISAEEEIRSIDKLRFSLGKTGVLVLVLAAPIVAMAVTMDNPMGDLGNTGFQ